MEPRTRRALPLLVGFISLTLSAGVGELAVRIRDGMKRAEIRADGPDRELCVEADPELIYRYRAGVCGFNDRGYRDDPHPEVPPPGVLRFAVIGDSVAAGDCVELEERFDRELARGLAERGVPAEAVNLARTGYSTSQELQVLEREAYAYAPDLVVWSYVLNDPAHPVFHGANGKLGRYFYEPRSHLLHRLHRLVFDLREDLAERSCDAEYHAQLHCVYTEQVSADIARIGALAREHATPTLFVIHPVFEKDRSFAESSLAPLHERLAREAREAGLSVVDLLDAYRGREPRALQCEDPDWFDPWHPNALGHAVVAEALVPAVLRLVSGKQDEAGDGGGDPEQQSGTAEQPVDAARVPVAGLESPPL